MLHVYARGSLLKIKDRLRGRFNVAVAELDHQDLWQQATLGVVSISGSQPLLESILRQALVETEKILGSDVASHNLDFF